MDNLRDLAVLVKVSMTAYSPRVLDKAESKKLTQHKGAKDGSAKVIRDRLAGTQAAEVLAEIVSAQSATRQLFYARTLPWDDTGRRMASTEAAYDLIAELRKHEDQVTVLVSKFIAAWPSAALEARAALNGLWKAEDYDITPVAMQKKFSVRFELEPMPHAADIRIDAPDAIMASLIKQQEDLITERFQAGCKDAFKRFYAAIERMHEKLSDPDAKVYESVFGNLKELVDLLPVINVGKDPELTRIAKMAGYKLLNAEATVPPSALALTENVRADKQARRERANDALDILKDMKMFMGGQTA